MDLDYGSAPENSKSLREWMRAKITEIGQRRAARESSVSRRTIERLIRGQTIRMTIVMKILRIVNAR
jgi:hypothetical protein